MTYDLIVIGAGFYGSMLSIHEAKKGKKVLLIEKEPEILSRASANNQAIIHRGYHYPRSAATAISSSKNASKFEKEFKDSIYKTHFKFHGISTLGSHVTPQQYYNFCNEYINNEIAYSIDFPLRTQVTVFDTPEYSFNYTKLKKSLLKKLKKVDLLTNCQANNIQDNVVYTSDGTFKGKKIALCGYSEINTLLHKSQLPIVDLNYQLCEMVLVESTPEIKNIGFTLMDGPFFSLTPFPAKNCHILSHVVHSVHASWKEGNMYFSWHKANPPKSNYKAMFESVNKYLPDLKLNYKSSIFEVKSLLPVSCHDDGRPILMKKINKYVTVINGSKLDNVYDLLEAWDGKESKNVAKS